MHVVSPRRRRTFTLRSVNYEFRPDAGDPERAALVEALRELESREPAGYRSAWRRAAIDPDDEDDYAVAAARPRSGRGATRA